MAHGFRDVDDTAYGQVHHNARLTPQGAYEHQHLHVSPPRELDATNIEMRLTNNEIEKPLCLLASCSV